MTDAKNSEIVIRDTVKTIDHVKSNWRDPLGEQYICWLEQTLENLKRMERSREIIRLRAEKIALLCGQAASADSDQPKVRRKTQS